jgi:hypothetical protein
MERIKMVNYVDIMVFAGIALCALFRLQLVRILKGGQFSTNFVVVFGFILIATLGAVLVFAGPDSASKTPAFTLFGIIAGYLAGKKTDDGSIGSSKTRKSSRSEQTTGNSDPGPVPDTD